MGLRLLFGLSFLLIVSTVKSKSLLQKFDKAAFYSVMASGSLDEVNQELDVITSSSTLNKEGYEGALLMRKAGLLKKPAERLKAFKAGRIKLETALLSDKDNTEYHFLRLAIQEHAPKIVKYNKEIDADKQLVIKGYKSLPAVVQNAIMDYTKNSKLLNSQDLG